jgi:hypothetical protein
MTERNVFEQNDFEAARRLLQGCVRTELRDHAFCDREIFWTQGQQEVATGYFGGSTQSIDIHTEFGGGHFIDEEAVALVDLGVEGVISRNDETGPDYYGGP